MIPDSLSAVVLSLVAVGLYGCGTASDQPTLGKVTGTITMDDKPLYGVAVVFAPEKGRPARGRTDLNGKYELTYIRDLKGTKIGRNRVEVAPNEEGEEDGEEQANAGENTEAAKPRYQKELAKVPARYNTKSELSADVKPGENVFDFKLSTQQSGGGQPATTNTETGLK